MWIVGVDENGLGPRLGPLVATALTVEVDRYDASALDAAGAALKLGDSKRTSGFGRMARAEALTLALAEATGAKVPGDADALFEIVGLDRVETLRARCPDDRTAQQCWTPLALPAFGGELAHGRALLSALREEGVHVRRVRSALACAGSLNAALAAGSSKLRVDLALFERLILDAREASPEDVTALCGMVGGIRRYGDYFTRLPSAEVLAEVKGASRYRVPGIGHVSFEVKADDRHLPVGLASMVGKYIRELSMARLVAFYRAQAPELPRASGYHDKVTGRFVEGSRALRRRLAIAPACFERRG